MAEGFELRGAIFEFGKFADDETNKVLKISTLEHWKLNQAPVHNLNEERSVGWVNHEIYVVKTSGMGLKKNGDK